MADVAPSAVDAGPGRSGIVAAIGALGSAILASLCCVGPILFVTLGVGAGLASRFEPLRPLFTGVSIVLLAVGFYVVYGPRRVPYEQCLPGESCAVPRRRRRDTLLLWTATVLAVALLTFPEWSVLVL